MTQSGPAKKRLPSIYLTKKAFEPNKEQLNVIIFYNTIVSRSAHYRLLVHVLLGTALLASDVA
jgi:hypothetical protein